MTTADQQFQGVYGTYAITDTDRRVGSNGPLLIGRPHGNIDRRAIRAFHRSTNTCNDSTRRAINDLANCINGNKCSDLYTIWQC